MFGFLARFFATDTLSPHGICLTWRPELIWIHVISDAVIGLAYFSIPVVLATFVSRRRDIDFGWVFWFFAVFILACGTTHFMSIWTLWVPDYGLEGIIKAVTALVSIATAVALWPLLPKALALPSPKELRRANEALTERVRERDAALVALARSNAEREKVEDMLRQSQKMEAIGQFTGGMAHDFNNLLGVVMGNLERLERRVEADRVSLSAVHNAQEASNRAATVVHKLLAFARKQPLLPSVIDVNTLVRDVLPLVQGIVGGSAISLDLAATQQICVDANQMESALLNLIVNARDAMPDSGTLTIRTKDLGAGDEDFADGLAPAEYVVVEIHDTGVGMSDEVRDRAFEPFFTTKSVGQGTGLGLSQVFGFVKQSGGNVRVFSQAGAGTCVALYIPSVTTDASSGQPAGQPVRDRAAGHV